MSKAYTSSDELRQPLFEGIHLSEAEINALDRVFETAQEAHRNTIEFAGDPGRVAFTPAAALAIGVANLAFSVYTAYGKSLADRFHIRANFKELAERLAELEGVEGGAPAVDVLQRLRADLRAARGHAAAQKGA